MPGAALSSKSGFCAITRFPHSGRVHPQSKSNVTSDAEQGVLRVCGRELSVFESRAYSRDRLWADGDGQVEIWLRFATDNLLLSDSLRAPVPLPRRSSRS